jgi:hypothetical protein
MGWLVLAVGPIALAAIILWARDRYRDAHNISEATRKLIDGKNVEIAKGFIFVFYFLGCAYQARAKRQPSGSVFSSPAPPLCVYGFA